MEFGDGVKDVASDSLIATETADQPVSALTDFPVPMSMAMPSTVPAVGSFHPTAAVNAPSGMTPRQNGVGDPLSMDMPTTVPAVGSFTPLVSSAGVYVDPDANESISGVVQPVVKQFGDRVPETSSLVIEGQDKAKDVSSDEIIEVPKVQFAGMTLMTSCFPICLTFVWIIFMFLIIIMSATLPLESTWRVYLVLLFIAAFAIVLLLGGASGVIGYVWMCIFCSTNSYCRNAEKSLKTGCFRVGLPVMLAWLALVVLIPFAFFVSWIMISWIGVYRL